MNSSNKIVTGVKFLIVFGLVLTTTLFLSKNATADGVSSISTTPTQNENQMAFDFCFPKLDLALCEGLTVPKDEKNGDHLYYYNEKYTYQQNCVGKQTDSPELKKFRQCLDGRINKVDSVKEDKKTCTDAYKDFADKYDKWSTACSAAKMGSGSACLDQAKKCGGCTIEEAGSADCEEDDVGAIESLTSLGTQFMAPGQTMVTPMPGEAQKRFSKCPALASGELKEINEAVDKNREKVTGLKEELSKLETQIADQASVQRDTETAAQDAIDKLDAQVQQRIQETQNKKLDLQKQEEDGIVTLQQQILAAEEEVHRREIEKTDVRIKTLEDSSKSYLDCVNKAQATVNAINDRKAKLIGLSLYSAGGFSNLLKSAGLTKDDRLKTPTKRELKACMAGDPPYGPFYKESLKIIAEHKAQELARIDQVIREKKIQIAQFKNTIETIKGRLPGELKKLYTDLALFQEQVNKQMTSLQTKLAGIREDQARKAQTKQKEYADKQSDLQREENYLNQRQSYASIAQQFSRGVSVDKDKADEAMSLASGVTSAATSAMSDCNCCGDKSIKGGNCSNVRNYLKQHYDNEDPCEANEELKNDNSDDAKKSTGG